jgi:hypothetical protein
MVGELILPVKLREEEGQNKMRALKGGGGAGEV